MLRARGDGPIWKSINSLEVEQRFHALELKGKPLSEKCKLKFGTRDIVQGIRHRVTIRPSTVDFLYPGYH